MLFRPIPFFLVVTDHDSHRWEALFGDMSDSSSMTSDEITSAGGKPGDEAKTEARGAKKVSCLEPERPVLMSADA